MDFSLLYDFNYDKYQTHNNFMMVISVLFLIIIITGLIYMFKSKRSMFFSYALLLLFSICFQFVVVDLFGDVSRKEENKIYVWVEKEYKPIFENQESSKDYSFKYVESRKFLEFPYYQLSGGIKTSVLTDTTYDTKRGEEYISFTPRLNVKFPEDLDQRTVEKVEDYLATWTNSTKNNRFILHDSE